MGTRGLFTLYDEKNNTYYFYYINSDSLMVLRQLRGKFAAAKSIKAIYRVISKAVEAGHLHIEGSDTTTQSDKPMAHSECWPFREYTMTVSINNETDSTVSETWTIEPVMETMETGFEKAKKQRGAIEGANPKNGEAVKVKKVKSPKPVKLKKPKKVKAETGDEKPKRKNPYILFSSEKRAGVKEANPEMKPKDIVKELSAMWKALSDEDKAPYKQQAMEASSEFFEAKAAKEASKVEKPKRKAGRPKKQLTAEDIEAKLETACARAESALATVVKLQRQLAESRASTDLTKAVYETDYLAAVVDRISKTVTDPEIAALPTKRKRGVKSLAGMDMVGSDSADPNYLP